MIDAAKLDETTLDAIERSIAGSGRLIVGHPLANAFLAAAREAINLRDENDRLRTSVKTVTNGVVLAMRRALRAEAESAAYRALIDAHNARLDSDCQARQQADGYAGICTTHRALGRDCPECPRGERIEVAGEAKETK